MRLLRNGVCYELYTHHPTPATSTKQCTPKLRELLDFERPRRTITPSSVLGLANTTASHYTEHCGLSEHCGLAEPATMLDKIDKLFALAWANWLTDCRPPVLRPSASASKG